MSVEVPGKKDEKAKEVNNVPASPEELLAARIADTLDFQSKVYIHPKAKQAWIEDMWGKDSDNVSNEW